MSKKYDIFLKVPETIIIGYGFSSPVLLYTNEKGLLRLQTNISSNQFKILLEIFEKYRSDPDHRYIGPLAIKREPNSMYNKVMMKETEIVLEWKEAYKVDLIIQRYILSKGIKTSKIRISLSNEVKIYKIINQIRQDFKEDKVNLAQTAPVHENRTKSEHKNIFSEIAEENKNILTKDLHKRRSIIRTTDPVKKQDNSILKGKEKSVDFSRDFLRNESFKAPTMKNYRKSAILPNDFHPIVPKKTYANLSEYFESCRGNPCSKTIEELYRNLFNSRQEETNFVLEDMMYTNYFREKVNKIFCVRSQNLNKTDVYDIKAFKGLDDALNMMKEMKRVINGYFLSGFGLRVTKIICDFIEDIHQNVYFLKLRTYEYDKLQNHQIPKSFSGLQVSCVGKYCNIKPASESKPIFFNVFKKVIHDDEKMHSEVLNTDLSTLCLSRAYEKVKVCKNCYDYYTRNKVNPKRNYSINGFSVKKIKTVEASMILNEINPKSAAETVKIVPSSVKSISFSTVSQFNKISTDKPNKSTSNLHEDTVNFRKNFFESMRNEILNASLENEFYN